MNPDISQVLQKIRDKKPLEAGDAFPVKSRTFTSRRQATGIRNAQHARRSKMQSRMIKPENAAALLPQLPAPGEVLHAVIAGDFIFCDLFPAIIDMEGELIRMDIATLSLSVANIGTIAKIADKAPIHLLLSHYFRGSNTAIWGKLNGTLRDHPNVRISIARTHCKVAVIETTGGTYVIEGSANLRSSRNLEQFTIFNDTDLAQFHRGWMEEAACNQC